MLKDKKKKIRRKTINITLLPEITETNIATSTVSTVVHVAPLAADLTTNTNENDANEIMIEIKPKKSPRKKRETKPKVSII